MHGRVQGDVQLVHLISCMICWNEATPFLHTVWINIAQWEGLGTKLQLNNCKTFITVYHMKFFRNIDVIIQ